MLDVVSVKKKRYEKRRLRSKKHLKYSDDKPRMVVKRTNKYIYVQVIDTQNKVIASISSISKEFEGKKLSNNIDSAKIIGKKIAEKLKALKIKSVVFDRNGYIFHGKIKAIVEACREAGIKI